MANKGLQVCCVAILETNLQYFLEAVILRVIGLDTKEPQARPCNCCDCETELEVTFSLLLECQKGKPLIRFHSGRIKSLFLTVESSCGALLGNSPACCKRRCRNFQVISPRLVEFHFLGIRTRIQCSLVPVQYNHILDTHILLSPPTSIVIFKKLTMANKIRFNLC